MFLSLFLALAQKFIIPEVVEIVRKKAAANSGIIPTSEEVVAEFNKNILDGITKGSDWLASHPG